MPSEVTVDFDDSCGDVIEHRSYFDALERYDGRGTGYPDGTSSIIISDFSILNLVRELKREGIKLIRFREL